MRQTKETALTKVRVVAFDLDGTLLDNLPLLLESWKKALDKFAIKKTDEDVLKLFGKSTTFIAEELTRGNHNVSSEDVKNIKDEVYEKLWPAYAKLKPDVALLLEYIKSKGLTLAVVSSNKAERLWRILKFFGIDRFFDAVVGYDEVKRGKPYPDMLFKLSEKLKCSPKQIAYVGDTAYDVEAAKAAGALAVLIPSERIPYSKSAVKADFTFFRLSDVKKLFP